MAAGNVRRGVHSLYRWIGRLNYRMRGRGSGFFSSQRGSKNLSPQGADEKQMTCRSCDKMSRQLEKKYVKYLKLRKSFQMNMLFCSQDTINEFYRLETDERSCAVLESACSSTVCCKTWLQIYLSSLKESDRGKS